MNNSARYRKYALCREMQETIGVVRGFGEERVAPHAPVRDRVLLSGEGSSRIFPAKRLIADALRRGRGELISTEGARQSLEYDLSRHHLFVASNSGRTAEGVQLIRRGSAAHTTGVVTFDGTPIADEADSAYVLGCGAEEAVAATKSVVEQALFYDVLFRRHWGAAGIDLGALADGIDQVLAMDVPESIVSAAVASPVIYFAGRNDGVAEELTLKTNEITRKRSDFLEGTYAVHGIEEVMNPSEIVVLVDPYPEEEEKFHSVLREGVGMQVVAITHRESRFPTLRIPDLGALNPYLQLVAGWSVLVEIGIESGIDLDTPVRARKVGNEFGD